jgi:hypothetical protein
MIVCSNFAMTWDYGGATELVLLTVGQEIDGDLEFPWEQTIEERRVIEGSGTEPLPRGLVKGSLTFTAYKTHASDAAARAYIHSHRAEIHARRALRKTLGVAWFEGSQNYPNAVFVSANGRMSVDPDVARTAFTYTLAFPS